ncbi:MAG: metalloregulator ArsR/SmtB family transcription factor [Pseudomonadota bacterium]
MVELDAPKLDAVFHALGDATRRHMLRDLSEGERSVGELAAPFAMSLAAASKHIKALERAGLVRRTIRGRTHLCRLEARPLATAYAWTAFYQRFWSDRLDTLEDLLRQDEANTPPEGDR